MLTTAACGMPIGYSAILLPQLEATNGSMHIDDNMGSWIGKYWNYSGPAFTNIYQHRQAVSILEQTSAVNVQTATVPAL